MPELPEVETVRCGLAPVMEGKRFQRVEQRRADLRFPFPERFAERLAGRRVMALRRRAKYLLADIEGGEALIMHLGMSGRFTIGGGGGRGGAHRRPLGDFEHDTGLAAPHDHVVFHMAAGVTVTYNDPRRFGFMDLARASDLDRHPLFAGLGPEPQSNTFDAGHLARRAAGRDVDLKAFLLDQRTVAGLGNIYVAEALFRARLSPRRPARTIATSAGRPRDKAERLVAAIRAVIADAIAAGGSTLRDYHKADGSLGYFQHAFEVYGRDGEPCRAEGCSGRVRRVVQAGRSTFYCPSCQL